MNRSAAADSQQAGRVCLRPAKSGSLAMSKRQPQSCLPWHNSSQPRKYDGGCGIRHKYKKAPRVLQGEAGFMCTSIVRSAYIATAIVAMLISGCVTPPQGVPASTAIQKTTFSGRILNVWYFYTVQMDCTPGELPTVRVTSAPSHGSVQLQNVEHFTEFPATNQRFECNKKKSPSVVVVYTSNKTFVGVDKFTVKCVFPSGDVQTKEFLITVEQLPPA